MTDFPAILLAIPVLVASVIFVLSPIWDRGTVPATANQKSANTSDYVRYVDLLSRRNALYRDLLELDFDYSVDKIAPDDYAAQRQRLVAEGVNVLRQLDALNLRQRTDSIEKAVQSYQDTQHQTDPTCAQCGAYIEPGDRFCGECGAQLVEGTAHAAR
ncbi:MAG: zinc ribbon domain-containing protein [Chloroflexi bacterium]|nr:zinc ribbon domain-containing protein [Chloroflexota bacterium]